MIDTHCHLNLSEHFGDIRSEIERAKAAGVNRMIVIGIDVETSRKAVELANDHEELFAAVGWHPSSAADYRAAHLPEIEALANHPKSVAIGEIGFDFHWKTATPEQQVACLRDQLDLAQTLEKPVVFHCREAYPTLLDTLETREVRPYLFHCFAGDGEDLQRAMALDATFGIDGPITYKKATVLRELVKRMPTDRIVLETDSPYLTPEPHRGKPNHPAFIPLINNALAASLGQTAEETAEQTTRNAERFLNLPR